MADDDRSSIPSVIDGLTSLQRMILLCAFKNPEIQQVKEFIGYVSKHCATYGYDKEDIVITMTGMAQNYAGSNNINLLHPFGECSEYTRTRLSSITRHLFHESDEPLLQALIEEDGKSIEHHTSSWFMPIIPMVLVNGSQGIRTKYNPRDIIANIRCLLKGQEFVPMTPWYKWSKGKTQKDTETSCTTLGVVDDDKNKLFITELPIGRCAEEYEEFLKAAKDSFIQEYLAHRHTDGTVTFEVVMSPDQIDKARHEEGGFYKKFGLTTDLDTSNMLLLDADGKEKKYGSPKEILEDFIPHRLKCYEQRRSALLHLVEEALVQLENHISLYDEDLIVFNDKEDQVLFAELNNNRFYLPFMEPSMYSFVEENGYRQHRAEWFEKLSALDNMLTFATAEDLWVKDLRAFDRQLSKEEDEEDEAERRTIWRPVRD